MNIQIITSSYPAYPEDPSGTAGLFVRAFALELLKQGHQVVIQPVARKHEYTPDGGLLIDPLPWQGGDRELASLNLYSPFNWFTVLVFFLKARQKVIQAHKQYKIDRTLCMWAVPSGFLGYLMSKSLNKPYDVWALGSDIWRIRKIPLLGCFLLKKIIGRAERVFADGLGLCRDVEEISGRQCDFLPSSRDLPVPQFPRTATPDDDRIKLLFVGRYHYNKGPDLLLDAVRQLPQELKARLDLRMYGVGSMKKKLSKYVRQHGLASFVSINDGIEAHKFVDELSRADYLVIPSRIESIPVVFSDAMQMGTPVIATPVGDLRALIEEHRCGVLADAVSASSLARVLERVLSRGRRDDYAEKAHALGRTYRVSKVVDKWLLS
jgi:glycosyltransferase involved in cell wall biosynthesis